jgi:hypothetical protein
MAQSEVDCCNSALQRVGAASIMNLTTDNSREARQCRIAYDSNRRSELRKHTWNFSIKRKVLTPDTETPAFGYQYQFTLPTDCLRVIRPADPECDWKVEGRRLLTNLGDVLYLRYVADITDVTQWDPAFYDMLAIALAIDLVEPITNSPSKKATLQQDYKEALSEARKNNSFERGAAEAQADGFWLARLGAQPNQVNFTTPPEGF